MKKLRKILCVALVLLLLFTSIPAIDIINCGFEASAACADGCSFTREQIGEKYLKEKATCGKRAEYYYSCAVCGTSSATTNEAKTFFYGTAPEHNWGPIVKVPATCTEPESEVQICSRCGQKYARKGSGTGLGHELVVFEAKMATCTELGNNKFFNCNKCDKFFKDEAGTIETTVEAEKIAKGAHVFTTYTLSADATCTANAKEKAVCDICEEATNEREISGTMVAHLYKTYVSNNDATCVADGTTTATCEICHTATDTMTDVGSKDNAPHTPDVTNERCTLCGEMLVCLHTYSAEKLITKTPTCTVEGQKAIVCSKCKANKPGSEEVIPELGHDFEITTKASDATCTEDGKTFSGKCKRCNFIEVGKTIPALGHIYIGEGPFPTCTKDGYLEHCCIRCEHSYIETIPATGHNYPDNWSVLVEPDCETKGINVKICLNCNDLITQKLPKAGHADKDGDSKCDTCNKEIIVTEPDEPTEPDTPDEPEVPEEKPCSCDCHAGGIKAFFFKLINFFAKIFDKSARVCECGKSH